jgi:hypothetical protein
MDYVLAVASDHQVATSAGKQSAKTLARPLPARACAGTGT